MSRGIKREKGRKRGHKTDNPKPYRVAVKLDQEARIAAPYLPGGRFPAHPRRARLCSTGSKGKGGISPKACLRKAVGVLRCWKISVFKMSDRERADAFSWGFSLTVGMMAPAFAESRQTQKPSRQEDTRKNGGGSLMTAGNAEKTGGEPRRKAFYKI